MTMTPEHLRELAGVYIVKGARDFYLVAVRILRETNVAVYIKLKNIPTPSSNELETIPSRSCVEMSVTYSLVHNNATAELDLLEHNDSCGLGRTLERGTQGTVALAMTTLAFATKIFGVENIEFMDASQIECDGNMIDLRNFSLLAKGGTWYARSFPNVVAAYPWDRESLANFENLLVNSKVTQEHSNKILNALSRSTLIPDEVLKLCREVVGSAFARGETWRQMFEKCPCSFFVDTVVSVVPLFMPQVTHFCMHLDQADIDTHLQKWQKVYHT